MSRRKDFSLITAKKLLPISIFYNANVGFALASLKGVNIPMYIAIKRITPLAVLVSGYVRGKGKPPTQVRMSFWSLLCVSFYIQYNVTPAVSPSLSPFDGLRRIELPSSTVVSHEFRQL
jgi:hypothetical protein